MRPSILRARIVLFVAVVVVAIAQQVDYNTQVRNRPVTFTVATGQTLAAAIAALPAGGTLVIPSGTYTVSTGITVSTANITIQGQPGATVRAGANSIILLTFSGARQHITGVKFDTNSHTSVKFVFASGANNFTSDWNYFTGAGSTGVTANVIGGGPVSTGLYVGHNTCVTVLTCDDVVNVDQAVVEYQTCTTATNDCSVNRTALNAFTDGATVAYRFNTWNEAERFGFEWAGNGYRWIEFVGNIHISSVSAAGCISGGTDYFGGPTNQLQGGVIERNSCTNTGAAVGVGMQSYGIEAYGHDYSIRANSVKGPYGSGLIFDGYNNRIVDNYFDGIGTTAATFGAFGITENGTTNQIETHDNVIMGNTCVNAQSGCIAAAASGAHSDARGYVIRDNHDFRAPGQFSTDSSQLYQAIVIGVATGPVLIDGNTSAILAAVNGYTVPGTMEWACMGTGSSGISATWQNNQCTNQNVTGMGEAYRANSYTFMNGARVIGSVFTNLAYIGQQVTSLSSSTIQYHDNIAVSGATDFTLGSNLGTNLIVYASETGTNNAIAGTFYGVPALYNGLIVSVQLAHTLQAGANTFNLNGGGAVAIKRATNPGSDLGTAYALSAGGGGTIRLMYNSYFPVWVDLSQ